MTNDVYEKLRDWYLAGLREEAQRLAAISATLTPLAQIERDHQLLSDALRTQQAAAPQPGIVISRLLIVVWSLSMLLCLVWCVVAHAGDVVSALTEFWSISVTVLFAKSIQSTNDAVIPYLCVSSLFTAPCLLIGMLDAATVFSARKLDSGNSDMKMLTIGASLDPFAVKVTRQLVCIMLITVLMLSLTYAIYAGSDQIRIILAAAVWTNLAFTVATLLQHAHTFKQALRLRALLNETAGELRTYQRNVPLSHEEAIAEILALLSVKEKFIADYSSDLLLALDSKWHILECNNACWTMLGYLPRELVSRDLLSLAASRSNALDSLPKQSDLLPSQERTVELCLISKSGELVDISVRLQWSERQQAWFAVAQNVSATKQIERARSQFLSMISHDVRSPLLSVLMGIQAIADGHYGETTSATNDAARRAERNVYRVIDLVGEIIDIESCTSGAPELVIEKCNLGDIVPMAIEQVRDMADHLQVTISNAVEFTILECDTKRIVRVLVNLLSNAVKYAGQNSCVEVSTTTMFGFVKINVKDNGPGIPENLHMAVFDQYFHAAVQPANSTAILPSSGLGLPICKVYVEAHGGEIGVASTPGQGSTFWFTLPLKNRSLQT